MKNKLYLIALVLAVSIMLGAGPLRSHAMAESNGTITVCNESSKNLYITIDDRNEGPVDKNSSESFKVKLGEHKICASWNNSSIKEYCTLTESSPDYTWSISNNDTE
jgi:hypothetical protein